MSSQPFESDVPPENAGACAGMIDWRDHADRANDMPILFDEARRGAEVLGDPLNEAAVQHARSSERNRHIRSCGAPGG